ncbi:hypothetical protein C5610_12565 [Idiomarina sp. OT37-5b]|jgi:hypothetical protein|uniref:DUF2975 domain-containing protein n=1 Tax=Idiomarina sp. OT37-5b TaxID=2100422 RepID=UPI000CF89741|nr:DUF2975 domain-containing protein [Idiomarina sp. OT37-5b]AVJ57042.1 hypothetical protein C5610_12565 [Idiomarina sp. OT37-5b]
MTTTHSYRLINFALVITVIATLSLAVVAIILPALGEHMLTTWHIEFASSAGSYHDVLPAGKWGIESNQGTLYIQTSGFGFAISRALTILLIGGLISYALCGLRQFMNDLQTDRPFKISTPTLLKKVATSFIALAVLLYVEVIIRFYLFMPDAFEIASFYVTHIKVSPAHGESFYIFGSFYWGLLAAGLFLLAISRAFTLGLSLQTENDEII